MWLIDTKTRNFRSMLMLLPLLLCTSSVQSRPALHTLVLSGILLVVQINYSSAFNFHWTEWNFSHKLKIKFAISQRNLCVDNLKSNHKKRHENAFKSLQGFTCSKYNKHKQNTKKSKEVLQNVQNTNCFHSKVCAPTTSNIRYLMWK